MPNPPAFTVTVTGVSGNTSVNPPILPVPWVGTGVTVTINWMAQGGNSFPTSGFFSWKSGSPTPGNLPTRVSDTQLQLTYTAPATATVYKYNIKLNNFAQLDPDINNDVPPGDEDDQGKPGKPPRNM